MKRLFVLALFLAAPVWAATLKPVGMKAVLSSAQATNAASTNAIDVSRGYDTLVLFSTGTQGGATQTLQISCDGGTNYVNYPGPLTITTLPGVITLADPAPCIYQTVISGGAGASITTTAFVMGAK